MRIAIDARFIQDHFPGIGRYTYNLVRHLAEISDDQFIVFHNPALRNSHYDVSVLGRLSNVTLTSLLVKTFSLGEQWRLPLAAVRQKADLLHTPYYIKPYLPPLPSVSTVYDTISARYPEYLPSKRARFVFEVSTRLALATSRRVLTLSDRSRQDLIRLYGTSPDKLSVTHLAADPAYRPIERAQCEFVRARYDLPARFALYVGINKPHKNLVTLIEALAIARRDADVRLVIAGAYDKRWPQVQQAVDRASLSAAVRFVPNVPEADLPALYNLADFFVFPSLYEGFGLPPLEAMACGLPIICSNAASLPEVVGNAGPLLDPLDVCAWAASLTELWESPVSRAALGELSLARAAEFSWTKTARQTLAVYREALAT